MGLLVVIASTFECEGSRKPAFVAEKVIRYYP
jgi:hypothetical protein